MRFQFLHIEKTAGMSLHAMLHRDNFLYISPDPSVVWDPNKKPWPMNFLSNGGHSIVYSENFDFQFTILRNPLERYLSHFNWRTQIMNESISFDEFITMDCYKNFQWKKIKKYTGEEEVEDALGKFDFVGMFEDFDKTSRIICEKLSLKPVYYIDNNKQSEKKIPCLDNFTKKIIMENNEIDFKVYERAKNNFYQHFVPDIEMCESERGVGLSLRFKQKASNFLLRRIQCVKLK